MTHFFTCAERLGIPVPTSCNKQGKCKECSGRSDRGHGLHSRSPLRLSGT